MATLALAAAGAAIGGALLPAGITVLGATIGGAAIGSQLGAMAGSIIDQSLFAASGQARHIEGPRLSNLQVTASTEGAPLPRTFGAVRLGGQIIWATEFEEEIVTTREGGGSGKGMGGGGSGGGSVRRTDYRYYASFAVALAEGEISGIGRVWADGREIDLSDLTYRVYTGAEDQAPDTLIAAIEGADAAPAYRGTAYIVFERLPLADFGNRLPQLAFEIFRSVDPFESLVRAVTIIPGAGEFVYAESEVVRVLGVGQSGPENTNTLQGGSDFSVSLDQLQMAFPNVEGASLVVSWFGTDLRAGHCALQPGVDSAIKSTSPDTWSVAGLTRGSAYLVSSHDGRPAYGGTPSDASVVSAIQQLKARNIAVTFAPFILMDIPAGNSLADPYTGAASQPSYPWRGRITVDPSPGRPGTPDKTAAAAAQLASLIGTAQVSHFAISGTSVIYSGPVEWSFRRFILHYAHLCKAAGGVDAFLLGSELKALTQIRSAASTYPFVAALVTLAADVRAVLGPATKISYAADWSEYFGHHPADGSGDVHFHLDPLWASPNVDAIAIDLYWPLADWRDGRAHADYLTGARSAHDLAYLKSNLQGGEGHAWYYASDADRQAQVRTPITDGAHGKPWVFRYKDIRSWWLNPHYNRPGGIESPTPTAWVPQSKPFWLTELGCPAVDKGPNQPNVFIDPKSGESQLPHFSRGHRDDLVQRRYLQAFFEGLDPAHPGYVVGSNPTSTVYSGRMVDLSHIHLYAWDARPFPAFPGNEEVWSDSANWALGHWLNGRAGRAPLDALVATILDAYGFDRYDVSALLGFVDGFVIDRTMSAREALQPLELAFNVDAVETGGSIRFRQRGREGPLLTLSPDDLVEAKPGAELHQLTRAQETELPATARIAYIAGLGDYRPAVAQARRLSGASGRAAEAELPLVLPSEQADAMAETWLFETWAARERAILALPPSRLALEPGDALDLDIGGRLQTLRITSIGDHGARDIEALSLDPDVYVPPRTTGRGGLAFDRAVFGQAFLAFLDLPLLRGDEPEAQGYVAAQQSPWPGSLALNRSPSGTGFVQVAAIAAPATTGVTLDPLPAGPEGRIDRSSRVRVRLERGSLASVTRLALLGGANVAAVAGAGGEWEILQFEAASLVAPSTYELSGLLRAQAGTEPAMAASSPLAAGARFVLLDGAVTPVPLAADELGLPFQWRYGPASRDIGHASYTTATHAFRGVGRRPLSPVHVRGTRSPSGDLTIRWIRRTRSGGDALDALDVPLAEAVERYEVDVLDGTGAVKRTLAVTAPTATYSASDQTADFGAPQSTLTVRVAQIGAVHGRGSARTATV